MVDWVKKKGGNGVQQICDIAMKFAGKCRKKKGTREDQLKCIFDQTKEEKKKMIKKCRQDRKRKRMKMDNDLRRMNKDFIRDKRTIKKLNGKQIQNQVQLWRLLHSNGGTDI